MLIHERSDDIRVMKIRMDREKRWKHFIASYKEGEGDSLSKTQIMDTLRDLQEYIYIDFPINKLNEKADKLRLSYDSALRVAISLAEGHHNDLHYASKNLYLAIRYLLED